MPSFQLCVCFDGTDSMAGIVEMASRLAMRAHLILNCCLCTLPARLVDRTMYSLGLVEGATVGMIRVGFTLVGGALITLTVRMSRFAYLESLIDQSLESETEMRLHHSFTKLGVRGQNE